MRDGRSLSKYFRAGRETPQRPMSDAEVDAKMARGGGLGRAVRGRRGADPGGLREMGADHQGRRSRGRVRNVAPLPPCLKHRASTRRFDWGESARGAGELPDGAGGDDGAVFRVGLVVLLDVAEVVEIVDHQATGLAAAAQRLAGTVR